MEPRDDLLQVITHALNASFSESDVVDGQDISVLAITYTEIPELKYGREREARRRNFEVPTKIPIDSRILGGSPTPCLKS